MTRALVMQLWRRTLASPVRLTLIVVCAAIPAVTSALSADAFRRPGVASLALLLVVLPGFVGEDLRSGAARHILLRPVPRWKYVLSRWLGAASLGAILSVVQLLLLAASAAVFAVDGAPRPSLLAGVMLQAVVMAIGLASSLSIFSVLLPGMGDLAAMTALLVATMVASELLTFPYKAQILRVVGELSSPGRAFDGSIPSLLYVASTSFALLVAACCIMARRELPAGGAS